MGSMVSIDEKKEFLKWFLNAFQLKRRECAWLLNYLISDDGLMSKVHFVEGAEYCPKGLVITTTDIEKIPFCYYKHKHITMDAEKAFHDIRLNSHEEIYIQLNFPNSTANSHYAVVLEENPFIPKKLKISATDGILAEMVLDQAIMEYNKKILLDNIDKALDQKDQVLFKKLTQELKEFENNLLLRG